jgi:hypothetical protein
MVISQLSLIEHLIDSFRTQAQMVHIISPLHLNLDCPQSINRKSAGHLLYWQITVVNRYF